MFSVNFQGVIKGVFIISITSAAITAGITTALNFFPVQREVIEEVVKVEKIKKVVIPIPSDVKYPPLKKPSDVCHGAPGVIEKIEIAGSQENDNAKYTWLTLRPAGDIYIVQCYLSGDYSNSMHVGDLVSIPQGKLSSGE